MKNTTSTVTINKAKYWVLVKTKKTEKPLAWLIMEGKNTQKEYINNPSAEKKKITTNATTNKQRDILNNFNPIHLKT